MRGRNVSKSHMNCLIGASRARAEKQTKRLTSLETLKLRLTWNVISKNPLSETLHLSWK